MDLAACVGMLPQKELCLPCKQERNTSVSATLAAQKVSPSSGTALQGSIAGYIAIQRFSLPVKQLLTSSALILWTMWSVLRTNHVKALP